MTHMPGLTQMFFISISKSFNNFDFRERYFSNLSDTLGLKRIGCHPGEVVL